MADFTTKRRNLVHQAVRAEGEPCRCSGYVQRKGAGYIGSHSVLELMEAGYGVTVVDSLVNAVDTAIDRIKEITGKPDQVGGIQP